MKTFEISSRKTKNGRRKFKAILYEIFPDSCIDAVNEVGTEFNENGITWIQEYCEKALPSIKGMSLRCEFLDEERTELCGHGETEIIDGLPIFENAVVIGTFSKGYIQDIETEKGTKKVCIGEGEIDALCYNNFVKKLEEDLANGDAPNGSVEILKTDDNDGIIYKYGYKDKGRIPTVFEHSGYALLGIRPADQTAKILELNSKEELHEMTDMEVKSIVTQAVSEMSTHIVEINKCKEECETKIAEANAKVSEANELVATVTAEKDEAIANSAKIQEALDAAQKELSETYSKLEGLYAELEELREELGKAKAAERVNELNSAIASFSDEEKAYAQAEIDAFNAEPITSEINSVVNKIWEGIGKKAKEAEEQVTAEQNSAKSNIEDIFSEVGTAVPATEDTNIF